MFDRFNLGEIIGANIKARRKAAGMTQIELANKCGCYYDSQPVREWEHGRVPKLETLERIADGLSCYVSELLPSYYFPPKKDGWISVKDRLPVAKEVVLAYESAFDSMSMAFMLAIITLWTPSPTGCHFPTHRR